MPNIDIAVSHSLEQSEALSRIQNLIGEVKAKFADRISDVKENWSGNRGEFSLTVMGMSVSGNMEVGDDKVRIHAKIPFAAIAFKGKIEEAIREKARTLLA